MRWNKCAALALALSASWASADSGLDRKTADAFLQDYYSALKGHNAARLDGMIDDKAKVVVMLVDENPPLQFTLSKADFLQQIESVWHFATRERYDVGAISWREDKSSGGLWAFFSESESRTVLETETGQRNQLEVLLVPAGQGLRIAAIKSHSSLW